MARDCFKIAAGEMDGFLQHLGDRRGFARRFRTPIEKNGDDGIRAVVELTGSMP